MGDENKPNYSHYSPHFHLRLHHLTNLHAPFRCRVSILIRHILHIIRHLHTSPRHLSSWYVSKARKKPSGGHEPRSPSHDFGFGGRTWVRNGIFGYNAGQHSTYSWGYFGFSLPANRNNYNSINRIRIWSFFVWILCHWRSKASLCAIVSEAKEVVMWRDSRHPSTILPPAVLRWVFIRYLWSIIHSRLETVIQLCDDTWVIYCTRFDNGWLCKCMPACD